MDSTALLFASSSVPIIGLVVFFVARRWGSKEGSRASASKTGGKPIGMKFVADPAGVCSAAQRANGHVFTCDATPSVPLPGCKRRKCKCALQPTYDRRHQARRSPRHVAKGENQGEAVRTARGRRRDDRLWHDVS